MTLHKKNDIQTHGYILSNQLKALRAKIEVYQKRRNSVSKLQDQTNYTPKKIFFFKLQDQFLPEFPVCPTDCRLSSLHNCTVAFSSFAQQCLTLCYPMDCSGPHGPLFFQQISLYICTYIFYTHTHILGHIVKHTEP